MQYWPIFYVFLTFYCYLICQKAPGINLQNMRNRSSHQRCSMEIDVLKIFTKFTEKYLYQSLFFNKVAGLKQGLSRKRPWRRCFPVNFGKFLRTPFLQNTSGRLLLDKIVKYLPYCTWHRAITCTSPKFVHLLILRGRRGGTRPGIRTIFQMDESDGSTFLIPPFFPSSSF